MKKQPKSFKPKHKNMPFKENPEGQTHYYGDGCLEHSNKTPMEEFEELAHAYFEPGDKTYWDAIEFAKDFFKHERPK